MNKLCECGCKREASISKYTDKRRGLIKGQQNRFINGHNERKKVRYIVNENGCWVWQLFLDKEGYGKVGRRKSGKTRMYMAHRVYYEKHRGKIPDGLQIDHLCRNHSCVNPEHLEAVTTGENTRRGDRTKLTWKKVKEIRRLWKTGKYYQQEIGNIFNIDQSTVSYIVNKKLWKYQ